MSMTEIDQAAAAVAIAPRVTKADIDEIISRSKVEAHVFGTLTIAIITLPNGFQLTGESAAASPENFDAELGAKIAIQRATEKLWPLLGYTLRERLHSIQGLEARPDRLKADTVERLGVVADRMDAVLVAYKNFGSSVSPQTHLQAITTLAREARDILADVVKQESGEDPWATNPLQG